MPRGSMIALLSLLAISSLPLRVDAAPPNAGQATFALLKAHCVRCHGPAVTEGGLNLALPAGIRRGGESGAAVEPGPADNSLLWRRVRDDEMPPDHPLADAEKEQLREWFAAGAPGLPAEAGPPPVADEHWVFQPLQSPERPRLADTSRVRNIIDEWVQAGLEQSGLTLGPDAPREALLRRVSFDLTGLPPTQAEFDLYLTDPATDAYERMVERYLNSERFGERWGKFWLDAAGYADSHGHFSADTLRPYAWRYRDYVIRSLNADKPWDQFLREQLAGDELAGRVREGEIQRSAVELVEAAHFLQNSPDGTDSSDGNPDEVRADRYAVLDGTLQIMGTSLFGLTLQCARCHDHKFEPLRQEEYYQLQALLAPAFPIQDWRTPKQRVISTASAEELKARAAANRRIDKRIAAARAAFEDWERENPEATEVLFADAFDSPDATVAAHWTNQVPGDPVPAGSPSVQLDQDQPPGARIVDGAMQILVGKDAGSRVLSTRETFDWTPESEGDWIQATFDITETSPAAPYVGYYIALREYNNLAHREAGSILIDGSREGKAELHVNYPGSLSASRGKVGRSAYVPGKNYGVRVTNRGDGKFEVGHVVDGQLEAGVVTLTADDLPDGAFGFEYCCRRSYTVDRVRIESYVGDAELDSVAKARNEMRRVRRQQRDDEIKQLERQRPAPIELLPVIADRSAEAPPCPLLLRGNPQTPGDPVAAASPRAFSDSNESELFDLAAYRTPHSTGRRLAFAHWLTRPGSRPAGLLARVTVNRWWRQLFGVGIVATVENLGYSGAPPTHPELLEQLAADFVEQGWSSKAVLRRILLSSTYRQSSLPSAASIELDPENQSFSRAPLRRLDAEALRDGLLAITGELNPEMFGPPVPVEVGVDGEVDAPDSAAGRRRSIYLQQRRTQVIGLLETFDAPSIVFSCTSRNNTTAPVQSLALMNSPFVRARAEKLADRLRSVFEGSPTEAAAQAYRLVLARQATADEQAAAIEFMQAQSELYSGQSTPEWLAWTDFCHMLLASNEFLYLP